MIAGTNFPIPQSPDFTANRSPHIGDSTVGRGQDGPNIPQEVLAVVGETDLPLRSIKKRYPKLLLEIVNLPAEGGLSHSEDTRRPCKPSVLCNGFEVA
jgi:hypothetical protein